MFVMYTDYIYTIYCKQCCIDMKMIYETNIVFILSSDFQDIVVKALEAKA